jgi:Vitamin K-dependent gamma-carboxylase
VRRLLKAIAQYIVDLVNSAIVGWDRFFFTPADPIIVGLLRISLGVLLLWDLVVLGLELHDYLGSDGWISPASVSQYLAENVPGAWSFWIFVPDRWLTVAWAASFVCVALFTVGYASRVTAVLAWAVALSTVRRAPVALFGFDYMITTWTFYLAAFGASGHALSVDRFLLARKRRAAAVSPNESDARPARFISANLTIRLIQLHLCLIYGSAGLSKLMAMEWWNGTAMEMIILTPEFRRFDLVWLAAYPLLLNLMTHCGLFVEIAYPVLIWNSKLRPLVVVSATLLHMGIDLILGLTEFGLTMIAANLVFVSGSWLRHVAADSDPTPQSLLPVINSSRVERAAKRRNLKLRLQKSVARNQRTL